MPLPRDLKKMELLVVAWTEHFFGDDYVTPKVVPNEPGPDIRLDFTDDRTRVDAADALWFHGPSIQELPPKNPGQMWILMSMESDVNYPALKNPLRDKTFDICMTYRLDSDIPCVYPNWSDYGTFLEPTPDRAERGLAVYIASNPVEHRDLYVQELMRYLPVDCLGTCLNNKRRDDFVTSISWVPGEWESILSVLPSYKFYLAFENSITRDYVTERVLHALVSGVVPVYLGAPNVRDFMPDDDAVIVASEFASPRELANYLLELDRDDEAYQRHLRWKQVGFSDSFKRLVDLGSIEPRDRMAIKLAHGCERSCRCGGRLRDP